MELKVTDTFIEIDILVDGRKVGYAEVEPNKKELTRLEIWEPYQGIGYGKQAVDMLISTYGIDNLWVKSDNDVAMHVYKKAGFEPAGERMYEMKLKQ